MPSDAEIQQLIAAQAPQQPAWMPDWQWERYQEMMAVPTDKKHSRKLDDFPQGPGLIKLDKVVKEHSHAVAYAYTEVTSDTARAATRLLGSDVTVTAWVNGEQVLAKEVYRGAAMDQESVDIDLVAGTSTILLKICQSTGGWAFCARLGDEDGLPLIEGVGYGLGG